MKMVFAVISKIDEDITVRALNDAGFFATKLSTIGGFLKKSNTSIIVGTDDDKVPQVMDILRKYAGRRIEELPYVPPAASRPGAGLGAPFTSAPSDAGGATVFVLDVSSFDKF